MLMQIFNIRICLCVHTHEYVFMYILTNMSLYRYSRICLHVHTHKHVFIHILTNMSSCAYSRICLHVHTHEYVFMYILTAHEGITTTCTVHMNAFIGMLAARYVLQAIYRRYTKVYVCICAHITGVRNCVKPCTEDT